MSPRDLATALRWVGLSHYQIAAFLSLNLSETRRLLDPRAERLHSQWRP